ncbi:EAL domain-containing protein [Solirubrobacter sp. CPCC 204708]|uniref:EAL domain-containing protein n=1 Tax=Solirubrobacter deserti TaxID=2282478 RepID=A0ABT4RHG0_9ACTN|nr:EAL domain-containing protein [Solirubrobacter deserti]
MCGRLQRGWTGTHRVRERPERRTLHAQLDGIPVPCYVWHRAKGNFWLEHANRAAFDLTGERLAERIGRPVTEVFADRPEIADDLARVARTGETVERELQYHERRLAISFVPIGEDRILAHTEDVTALRENEERLRAVIATVEDGLLTVDLAGAVVDANPAACAILGIPREQLLDDPVWWESLQLRYADGSPLFLDDPDHPGARATRGEIVRDVAQRITRPDGETVEVSTNYTPLRSGPEGALKGVVIAIDDVTEARRLQAQVAHQALHDPLTGLPNRLLFQERLEQALRREHRGRVVVLLVGLDRFRAVNDTHGHAAGDAVLCEVAGRLRGVLEASHALARIGGDEFAVLAECEDERSSAELAQRLCGALLKPLETGSQITASVGIAVEEEGQRAADLLQSADAAMQRVKARGGNTFEIFDHAMEGRLRDRLKVEDGIRRAIAKDELRLVYQPIVELDPFRTVAVEALVRWQHPEEGLLGPARFLPVAEQDAQLISGIGRWVLHRACIEARRFPDDIRVSVNVAARELSDPDLEDRILGTLEATGTPPERIGLEITETTLMEGGDAGIDPLVRLADAGLYISLDDFGTGYSSLTRLATLPLNGIKLDRGFVARYTGERDRRIIEAAVSIGRAAELNVVAEGVETEDQLELLRAAGCGFVQGYLLGRPQPPEQMIAALGAAVAT